MKDRLFQNYINIISDYIIRNTQNNFFLYRMSFPEHILTNGAKREQEMEEMERENGVLGRHINRKERGG